MEHVTKAELDTILGKYTKLRDFTELDNKARGFAKSDFLTENLSKIKDKIDNLKRHISEKIAEKAELNRQEKSLKSWVKTNFELEEKAEEYKKNNDQKIKNLEEKAAQIAVLDLQ